MSLLRKIEEERRKKYLSNPENFDTLVKEGEAAIIKACSNLDPVRPYITSDELRPFGEDFHKTYSLYAMPAEQKMFIKHLEDSGLEVYAYIEDSKLKFKIIIPEVPEIYSDERLKGLKTETEKE